MDSDDMSNLPLERSFYIGNAILLILYGMQIFMAFLSWSLLSKDFTMLFLETISMATNVFMGQSMWLEHRNFPGGPFAYYITFNNIWYSIWGTACAILANILNDGLMLYRCFIIWNGSWRIIAFPILIYIGATVMGIISLVGAALPNATFFESQSTNFAIPWISMTTILNFGLTALISGRILYVSRSIRKSSVSPNYTGVVAILVESSLPLSLLGIVFAVSLGKNFSPAIALSDIWGAFLAFSPQLIIIRVAMGHAWTNKTGSALTGATGATIEFAYPDSRTVISQTYMMDSVKATNSEHEKV